MASSGRRPLVTPRGLCERSDLSGIDSRYKTLRNKAWDFEHPVGFDKSGRAENVIKFRTKNRAILGHMMLHLPSALGFCGYIKMNVVAAFIEPVPELMDDAPATSFGIECGGEASRPLLNQSVEIGDASEEDPLGSQLSTNIDCRSQ